METWKVNLYALWFSQILSIMSFSLGMPFIPFFIQELGVTDPEKLRIYTGLLNIAPAISMTIAAPVWGWAADRWGKKLMLLRAMFFASIVLVLMGFVANAEQLLLLRLLQGFFTGTVTAAAVLVASGSPSGRLSYALGFMSSSTFIGTSIGPIIGGFVAEHMGYRISFHMGGVIMLLDFFLVLFIVREAGSNSGEKNMTGNIRLSLKLLAGPMLLILLLLFVIRFARTLFTPFLPLFLQEKLTLAGGAVSVTGIISGMTGLATALAGLTLSRLGDRHSKIRLLKILFGWAIVPSILLCLLTGNIWVFAVIYSVFFFILGGIEPIIVSVATEATPAESRGMQFGLQAAFGNIGWIIAPLLGSAVSIRYPLTSILYLIPVSVAAGAAVMFFIRKNSLASAAQNDLPENDTEGNHSIIE